MIEIKIYADALRDMIAEASAHGPNESGGVLLGLVGHNEETGAKTIVVVAATEGGPKAKRLPRYFIRDLDYCQSEINRAFARSGGLVNYVGEYHRHVSACSDLSQTDRDALEQIAEAARHDPEATYSTPISAVVALPDNSLPGRYFIAFHVYEDGEFYEVIPEVIRVPFVWPTDRDLNDDEVKHSLEGVLL